MINIKNGSEDIENPSSGSGGTRRPGFDAVIGRSQVMRETVNLARKLATGPDGPILLLGEAGTGKELLARAMHYAGPHPQEPFVFLDCSALPRSLLESELFGRDGNDTDNGPEKMGLAELAGGGTLFLSEVCELSLELQARLVKLLESHTLQRVGSSRKQTVRCRVMASTTRPLTGLVSLGRFSEELFSRLSVYRVDVPPLRERNGDIGLLARHFLSELGREAENRPQEMDAEALDALHNHRWPGNVRELRDVMTRAHIQSENGMIHARDLTVQVRWHRPATEAAASIVETIRIPEAGKALDRVEAEAIQATLDITDGNQSAASRILGISRPTLARKIRRYDLLIPGKGRPSDAEG